MSYTLDIQKIVLKINETKVIADQLVLIKEAIAIADKHNDIDWGFDLRLLLINTENHTPRTVLSYPAFTWILNTSDSNEGYFEEKDFLYEYKWMYAISSGNPAITKEQLEQISTDFHKRLLKNGYSIRGYYHILAIWHQHLREYDKAMEIVKLMGEELVDELSDNPPFEHAVKTYNLLAQGKFDEAKIVARDLFANRFEFIETAFETYIVFAYEYFIRGNVNEAREYFELAKRKIPIYDENDPITHFRSRIFYMYLSWQFGEEDCWDVFEKFCIWENEADSHYSLIFTKHAMCLLKEGGTKKFNFPVSLPYYQESGEYNLEVLCDYFKDCAFDLVTRFDNRNGNNNFTKEARHLFAIPHLEK